MAQHRVAPVVAADPQLEDRGAVVDRRAQAVDARHGRDDDHVAPLEQRMGGGVAQPVDLLVPARVLLDVRVRARQVRLGLVVVEVADEVLDRVVREELAELGVQLGGKRLVVGEDERRLLVTLDRLGHRVRLAAAGDAQQRLVAEAAREPVDELVDRLRLVAGGLEGGDEAEVGHGIDGTTRAAEFERASVLTPLRRPARQPAPARAAAPRRWTTSPTRTASGTGTNDPFRAVGRPEDCGGHPPGVRHVQMPRPRPTASARPGPARRPACPSRVPAAPRGRSVAGRVLPDPDAAAVPAARDHPVRVHLPLGT